jgi:NNP family nitrate/nitrite transporter-like MFS transporter
MDITKLWKAPLVNPINKKAESIPALNPINMYGRVFFFSWFGFFLAFWYVYHFKKIVMQIH